MIGVATMRKFTGYEKNVTNSLHVFIFKCRMYSLNKKLIVSSQLLREKDDAEGIITMNICSSFF